jgi:hypothetical protein
LLKGGRLYVDVIADKPFVYFSTNYLTQFAELLTILPATVWFHFFMEFQ